MEQLEGSKEKRWSRQEQAERQVTELLEEGLEREVKKEILESPGERRVG